MGSIPFQLFFVVNISPKLKRFPKTLRIGRVNDNLLKKLLGIRGKKLAKWKKILPKQKRSAVIWSCFIFISFFI